jgi:predicted  nucleic acid-binding Zn-ribbon protein
MADELVDLRAENARLRAVAVRNHSEGDTLAAEVGRLQAALSRATQDAADTVVDKKQELEALRSALNAAHEAETSELRSTIADARADVDATRELYDALLERHEELIGERDEHIASLQQELSFVKEDLRATLAASQTESAMSQRMVDVMTVELTMLRDRLAAETSTGRHHSIAASPSSEWQRPYASIARSLSRRFEGVSTPPHDEAELTTAVEEEEEQPLSPVHTFETSYEQALTAAETEPCVSAPLPVPLTVDASPQIAAAEPLPETRSTVDVAQGLNVVDPDAWEAETHSTNVTPPPALRAADAEIEMSPAGSPEARAAAATFAHLGTEPLFKLVTPKSGPAAATCALEESCFSPLSVMASMSFNPEHPFVDRGTQTAFVSSAEECIMTDLPMQLPVPVPRSSRVSTVAVVMSPGPGGGVSALDFQDATQSAFSPPRGALMTSPDASGKSKGRATAGGGAQALAEELAEAKAELIDARRKLEDATAQWAKWVEQCSKAKSLLIAERQARDTAEASAAFLEHRVQYLASQLAETEEALRSAAEAPPTHYSSEQLRVAVDAAREDGLNLATDVAEFCMKILDDVKAGRREL